MRLDQYNDFLKLFNTIILISIPILCLNLYKIVKDKKLIFITVIFFIESLFIIVMKLDKFLIIENINDLYLGILILKLFLLFYLEYKINRGLLKHIATLLSIFILLYTLQYESIYMSKIYNIITSIMIVNIGCLKRLRTNHKNEDKYKNKLNANKKYINKISNEIEEEIRYQGYLKENIRLINYKLSNVIEAINIPIVMINSKNKCIMKNKYFDYFLEENNLNKNKFRFKLFIDEISKISNEDLMSFINEENLKDNSVDIDLNNKKYKFVVIKDYIENERVTLCQIKDITDIYEKEVKLKQSELRYKTLMDVLSDGVIIHDGNTVNYINKIAMNIFGIDSSVDNVLGMENLQSVIDKKSKDEFLHNIVSVSKGLKYKESSTLELESGRIVHFISCSFPMGNKKMIISIVSDFTQYQIALDKLQENEKTYSTLIQTLPEGIVLINKITKEQIYTNRYMMRILKEMGIEKFYKMIDEYTKDGDYDDFRTFYINNNEKKKKISMAIEQIPKQDNLLIVVRDLETEQQLENIYKSLEVIKERNKFKTEFLSRISTNLKKPITTIFEVNKMLECKKDIYNYDGVESYIKNVKQNSYRLKRLLSNIEEISKIEDGVYDRNYKTYDLVNYLEEMIKSCEYYSKGKELDIVFKSDRKEVLIYMDKDKIEKIILNILSNALKFTQRGGKISISINVNERDIIIAIEDNGFGIPSNKLDIIFENFEQVNRSLSREAEGTGVGLYLVKKLALIHHAKIKVNSKVGYGSKFEIILKGNLLDSTNENRKKVEDIIIDKESIDVEFSDIYL